jgi:indole-3-glycerol phosphate synthase
METVLDRIVAAHRRAAAADSRDLDALLTKAESCAPPRPFAEALRRVGMSLIAEIKRRSPSKGDLAADLDPATVAQAYDAGGASCLSVLTDEEFFGGAPGDLRAARAACGLPVLRKDFTVDRRDVADARIMGADAVLLIVAALDDEELVGHLDLARSLRMTALVEVHDGDELGRALHAGADVVGVNQRDLHTFEVDRERAWTLAAAIPSDVIRVAESGIASADDVARLADAGYDAILVGESVVTAADPAGAIRLLLGPQEGVPDR